MMKIDNLLYLNTREMLREWLKENHLNEGYCWILVSITSKPDTILYLDAVEEALCFGWIDGIKKKYRKNNWHNDYLREHKKHLGRN
ncbi:MAG: thymidylate synthase [Herbinix sp.]|jgi:uncharacterized protein YdeI (YjbR/CyaY-like superfamily)|nr:thymidylate synthase [Herbinix sp.]